jgi:hypothetical protein
MLRSSGCEATLTGNGFPWLYASSRPQQGAALAGFTGRSQPKSSVARQAESGDLVKKNWENKRSFDMVSLFYNNLH